MEAVWRALPWQQTAGQPLTRPSAVGEGSTDETGELSAHFFMLARMGF